MRRTPRPFFALILLPALACAGPAVAPKPVPPGFPQRVLITNDDGIDSPRIRALARAFAADPGIEVWVVAPSGNRSGAGASLSFNRSRRLTAEPRNLGPGIRAFAVDGTPADCVLLALLGIMRDAPPDLVVSGINAGPNLGADWIFSGTLGAARVAAIAGVHAMAVSGPTFGGPGAADSTAEWVVRMARGDLLRDLGPHGYLTVAFPIVPADGFKGVVAVDRAPLRLVPRFEPAGDGLWRVVGDEAIGLPTPNDSDEAGWLAGYIVVTPMRANEVDADVLRRWQRQNLSHRVKEPW